MRYRDLFANRPLTYLTSSIVGTVSVSVSVVMFFMNQRAELVEARHVLELEQVSQEYDVKRAEIAKKYEHAVGEMNSRLATIERRLGTTSDSFDVTRLIVTPRDAARWLAHSEYFTHDRFYGRRVDPEDGWTHEATTELALFAETTGIPPEELRRSLSSQQVRAFEAIPIHVWRGPEPYQIDGDYALKNLRPIVLVQKVTHDEMSQIFGTIALPDDQDDAESEPTADAQSTADNLAGLNSFYRGDAAGMMLSTQLSLEMQLAASFRGAARTYLKEIQKRGNVVYAQFETVLSGMTINGRRYDEFYLLRELILISTQENLYIVKTLVPTPPDFGSSAIAWINGWFGDFGIPAQGTDFPRADAAAGDPRRATSHR